jgi:hypothetical protein
MMRCVGSTGCSVCVRNSPGILNGSPYTSSADDACRSALNEERMPRRTMGSASVCMTHDGGPQGPVEVLHEFVR